jgi:hypothetical protein
MGRVYLVRNVISDCVEAMKVLLPDRNQMARAKEALQAFDTDRAQSYLDQANHEIGKLQDFLGRR